MIFEKIEEVYVCVRNSHQQLHCVGEARELLVCEGRVLRSKYVLEERYGVVFYLLGKRTCISALGLREHIESRRVYRRIDEYEPLRKITGLTQRKAERRERWSDIRRGEIVAFEQQRQVARLGVPSHQRRYRDRAAPRRSRFLRSTHIAALVARSLDRVKDHLTKRMDSLPELRVARSSDTQLFLFAMRANVRATGTLAHAWRDGDGHAQSTVRSVNVGSYPGSARLVAAQRIGEECQEPT